MYPPDKSGQFGIYIHWPFCLSKCPYCDFYSKSEKTGESDSFFLPFYLRDLERYVPQKTTSIFFGGGTPSLMDIDLVSAILTNIRDRFGFVPGIEITMEANPDAIDLDKMKALRDIGVNRLSMGVQALDDAGLKSLGRRHSLKTALERIDDMASVFDNFSIDLIYGRPGQTLMDWELELAKVFSLNLPHLSLYQLTVEDGTPFAKRQLTLPDDETARQMHLMTKEMAMKNGLFQYEVSNFSKPGFECRHNMLYWRRGDYIGLGPAAHGRIGNLAYENPRDIERWQNGEFEKTILSGEEVFEERLIMGLRIKEGTFQKNIAPYNLQKALDYGWITLKDNRIAATDEGFLVLNQLILLLSQDYCTTG